MKMDRVTGRRWYRACSGEGREREVRFSRFPPFLREKIRMSRLPVAENETEENANEREEKKRRPRRQLYLLSCCAWAGTATAQLTRANIPNKSILNQS